MAVFCDTHTVVEEKNLQWIERVTFGWHAVHGSKDSISWFYLSNGHLVCLVMFYFVPSLKQWWEMGTSFPNRRQFLGKTISMVTGACLYWQATEIPVPYHFQQCILKPIYLRPNGLVTCIYESANDIVQKICVVRRFHRQALENY